MLIAGPGREAVLEYWTDNTDGYLQFDVTMMPWVDVKFSALETNQNNVFERGTIFQKVLEETVALPGYSDMSRFDGFICLLAPGAPIPHPLGPLFGQTLMLPFDGGSLGRGQKGARAIYPLANSSHTFMCHEFGHVLGQFDDDGIARGTPPSTGYGDPLDIMAGEAFAGQWPMFAGTPLPDWPNPNAKDRMGPAPSRGVVHYWKPAAVKPTLVKTLTITDDNSPPERLYAAYVDAGVPRLLVLEPEIAQSNAIGRCYLEYRDVRKWDRGLETNGATLDRRSVVAHVAAMRPAPDFGAGDLIGNRCFYRGQIVIPVETDSDLQIAGTPYTVRVLDSDLNEAWVELKVTLSSKVGFDIESTGSDDIVGPDGEVETVRTPCGDTLHWGNWLTAARYAYRPLVWGLGGTGAAGSTPQAPPTIAWRVGGTSVPLGIGNGLLQSCYTPQGFFDVRYTIDDVGTLHLSSDPGQAYQMSVSAIATDNATGATVSAKAKFSPTGHFHGYPWPDLTKLLKCLQRIVKVFPPDLSEIRPPRDGPRPNWRELVEHIRANSTHIRELARERRALEEITTIASRFRL